jgi:hypothetical protein
MDMENHQTTITGSLVQQTSLPNSDPTENERKLMILLKLGSHYWTPSFTRAQARELLSDYLEDLAKYRTPELEVFAGTWRRDVARTKFPKIGDIVFSIERVRADAAARDNASKASAQFGGRPIGWWMQAKELWNPAWLEADAPAGALIRESVGGPLRAPGAQYGGNPPF